MVGNMPGTMPGLSRHSQLPCMSCPWGCQQLALHPGWLPRSPPRLAARGCRTTRQRILAETGAQRRTRQRQQPAPARQLPGRQLQQKGGDKQPRQQREGWGVFDWEAYQQPWEVTWGGRDLVLGMLLWGASFVAVGLLPLAAYAAGFKAFGSLFQLSAQGKAAYAFWNQVVETIVGIGIVMATVRKSQPYPDDVLRADFREPLKPRQGWLFWGGLGILAAPAVVALAGLLVEVSGYQGLGGRGTVDGMAGIIQLDAATYAYLLAVTAVLAPVLEETVFRGFLLAGLTRYLPVPAAVALSSVAFGLAHASPRDLPQLVALGAVLGFAYVRSRNLLTPMLIHGVWNGTVITVLFGLVSNGVDVQQMFNSQISLLPGMEVTQLAHMLTP